MDSRGQRVVTFGYLQRFDHHMTICRPAKLSVGIPVFAVIKASDVMIATE